MKKTIILSLIIFVSLNLNAQQYDKSGGHARILSLGSNPYIIDPEFIKVNPAWAQEYDNFLWVDIGSKSASSADASDGQFAGVNVRLNSRWTLGGIVTVKNSNPIMSISVIDPFSIVNQINNIIGASKVVELNNNFEALASYRFDELTLGLGAAYAYSVNNVNYASSSNEKADASQFGLNAGVLVKLKRNLLLDIGAGLILPAASYEPASGFKTKLSQTILMIDARAFINLSERLAVVPIVRFQSVSGSLELHGTSGDLQSVSNFLVGAGTNYSIHRFLLAGGVYFNYNKITVPQITGASPQLIQSRIDFPVWNLGAEWHATRWLIARIGYSAGTSNYDYEISASPSTKNEAVYTGYVPGAVTLGIGFRFGRFGLDATIKSDVLRQGLNNIGGGTPTFSYISSSYAF